MTHTKDEALQMCLEYIETDAHERKYVRHAIKQALTAQPAPVQHVALLNGIKRYEPEIFREDRIRMELDQSGEWVKYADVELLIATPPAAPLQPVDSEAKGAIMGAAYDFRDAHMSGSMNLKRSAHAALENALDAALNTPPAAQPAPSQYGSPELQALVVARAIEKDRAAQPAVQEPVGEVSGHDSSTGLLYRDLEPGTPLYTTPPAQPAPVQDLPFGVGGGLVAIKTLLSRDPCVHANTAIGMIDAILKEHPAAQPAVPDAITDDSESPEYRTGWNDYRAAMLEMMK
jgi:hypothetical protein